ncbi:MAG TPA: IPT/TIG domain-containing protein, partial [Pyrinomonadaceae bacterium]|nr:IPT/TIG domain-containing protein [Pyrinomonadaceae bacterium]
MSLSGTGLHVAAATTTPVRDKTVRPVGAAAQTVETFAVYGPRRFERTAGAPDTTAEQFSLPADASAPFTVHVQNGAPDGSGRTSSATVNLNGTELFKQSDFNKQVPLLTRTVTLAAANTLKVKLTSAPGSFLIITITATRSALPPANLESVAPTRGTQGQTLSVTLRGSNTHWVAGQTRATFGGEVSVGGAPFGEPGPVTVTSATTAVADLSISPTAALAPRTVSVVNTAGGSVEEETVKLANVFNVAAFEPPGAATANVTTVAGAAGAPGFADGEASQARFRDLSGIAIGADDSIYVADAGNQRIRVLRKQTNSSGVTSSVVSTLAGDGTAGFSDGAAAGARFNNPQGVAVDASGVVFVADTDNHRIRRIALDGTVATFAGDGTPGFLNGAGAQARFNAPRGIAVDPFGNIYVADSGNAAVRRIAPNGEVMTVAGDGTIGVSDSPNSRFDGVAGVAIDGNQIYIYLADSGNHRLRRLDATNTVITIAGAERGFADGAASQARFAEPSGIAIDGSGNIVVADAINSLVRLVNPALAGSGSPQAVTTLAGSGERGSINGAGNLARFTMPRGVVVTTSSAVVVADTGNHVLRRIVLPPAITSLSPARARAGQSITINGERFDGRAPERNVVQFKRAGAAGGYTSAQVTAATRKEVTVVVPEDATSGALTVGTEGGTATSPVDFELAPPAPYISNINPVSGEVGTAVTLTGTTLKAATGDTTITFTGAGNTRVPAAVSFISETEARTVVPNGAVTGLIALTNAEGTATSSVNFEVNSAAPVISDFNPKRGTAGTIVTLVGTTLRTDGGITSVTFAGANDARLPALVSFSSPTEVRTTVPNGASTGAIELTNAGGRAVTSEPFVVDSSQDFQLTASPSTATAVQRGTATYIVSLTSTQSTFTQMAQLSATGLPAGVAATFDPAQITAGANSTLNVSLANINLAPGTYPFTISGTSAVEGRDLVRTATATLRVTAGGQTTLSGRVLSTDNEPIMGATASLDGRTATTDAAGAFLLSGVTAGANRPLMVDGRTASAPNRTYPVILEPATIVAGQANVVPYTYFLPPIDIEAEVEVVPGQTTVAGNARVPGLQMTIPADANLRNRDGSPVARVSITPLAIDRTPAPLPPNVGTAMVYTSQPGGAIVNPNVAIPVVYPNLMGTQPGTVVSLYAFNHDEVRWYVYGYGRVSADGRNIVPEIDPNTGRPYGLRDFSWHFPDASPDGDPGDADSCPSGRTGNPVDLSTGMKVETATDISFGGSRGGISLSRIYTSDLANSCDGCPFGRGTTHNYDIRLTGSWTAGGAGRLVMPEQKTGDLYSYAGNDSSGALLFTTAAAINQLGDVVRKLSSGELEHRNSPGETMRFDSSGRLVAMVDINGN